ncbi:MAG TPA: RNA 2',3'-cyclic phosphodiesterase [Thermoanaerobaculaceae bacterium]|nr:RNA 2',3'-cyclic phosphodiesterase [Thermoanaerobaculaceae bacterium]HRS16050.1 RNA 2',3'-cyclic phosphodiesterase [Thermoanaerobaculaceae bacterium]
MRLFCAVDLPEAVRQRLERGIGELRRRLPPARWVRAEGVHVTLKFLGEHPVSLVEALDPAARSALAECGPVEVRLGGGGFFPGARRARVAWVGGQAVGLERWAAALEDAAATCGVAREARPFSLHLTLARLDRPWPEPEAERFLAAVGGWSFEPFVAQEVVLFESHLGAGGSRYTALRRWPVGGTHVA